MVDQQDGIFVITWGKIKTPMKIPDSHRGYVK
jgi:hypothetical protein